jgi:hypothetical protein
MKLKVTLVTLAAASLSASVAVAAPPAGKGPSPTGAGCKPMVTVVLKGTLTGVSASTLNVMVTSGNRWARAYVPPAAQPTTVGVDLKTKVRRQGAKKLDALVVGDRVLVQARACKADLLAEGTPPALIAVRVVAHPVAA